MQFAGKCGSCTGNAYKWAVGLADCSAATVLNQLVKMHYYSFDHKSTALTPANTEGIMIKKSRCSLLFAMHERVLKQIEKPTQCKNIQKQPE